MLAIAFAVTLAVASVSLAVIVFVSLRFAQRLIAADERAKRRRIAPPPEDTAVREYAAKLDRDRAKWWLDHATKLEASARSAENRGLDALARRELANARRARALAGAIMRNGAED